MSDPLNSIRSLEKQIDPILAMYDFAEKQYGYNNLHGGDRKLNEDLHRKEMQTYATFGPTSVENLKGSSWAGLASIYLLSRRHASHALDFAPLRTCYWRTGAWYMVGVTVAQLVMVSAAAQTESRNRRLLHARVAQNDQTHNVLKTMKFHLTTRQMSMWEQLGN